MEELIGDFVETLFDHERKRSGRVIAAVTCVLIVAVGALVVFV